MNARFIKLLESFMTTICVMVKYYVVPYFDSQVKIFHALHFMLVLSDSDLSIKSDFRLIDGYFEVLTIRKNLGTFSF